MAQDCYRDAIVYKGWLKNPKRGRYPRVRRASVLTPRISFKLNLDDMKVRDVGELPILGYPRNLSFYKDWEIRLGWF